MNGQCVIIYMYMLITLFSRYTIFVLYLNIYLIAGVHIVKGECLVFSRRMRHVILTLCYILVS
jgi:hypothetical protein